MEDQCFRRSQTDGAYIPCLMLWMIWKMAESEREMRIKAHITRAMHILPKRSRMIKKDIAHFDSIQTVSVLVTLQY